MKKQQSWLNWFVRFTYFTVISYLLFNRANARDSRLDETDDNAHARQQATQPTRVDFYPKGHRPHTDGLARQQVITPADFDFPARSLDRDLNSQLTLLNQMRQLEEASEKPGFDMLRASKANQMNALELLYEVPIPKFAHVLIENDLKQHGHRPAVIEALKELLMKFGRDLKSGNNNQAVIQTMDYLLDYFVLFRQDTLEALTGLILVGIYQGYPVLVSLIQKHGFASDWLLSYELDDGRVVSDMALLAALRTANPQIIQMLAQTISLQSISADEKKQLRQFERNPLGRKLLRHEERILAAYQNNPTDCADASAHALKEFPEQFGFLMWSFMSRLQLNRYSEVKAEFLALDKKYAGHR